MMTHSSSRGSKPDVCLLCFMHARVLALPCTLAKEISQRTGRPPEEACGTESTLSHMHWHVSGALLRWTMPESVLVSEKGAPVFSLLCAAMHRLAWCGRRGAILEEPAVDEDPRSSGNQHRWVDSTRTALSV